MSYYEIIKEALYYGLGELEPADGMIDAYTHDKLLITFPSNNKQSINIYLYDRDYSLIEEFENATMRVYEKGDWIIRGIWKDYIDEYFDSIKKEIDENRVELEEEKENEKYEEERKYARDIIRFKLLFDGDSVKGILLPHNIDIDRGLSDTFEFEKSSDIEEFMTELFGVEIIDVPKEG